MAKIKKRSVVVGTTSKGNSVFRKLKLPDGKSTSVMNERVYRESLGAADKKLREIAPKRSRSAA
ncbi:MAG TPA: hypothetical protein VFD26_11255 [Methyloceanibacter sp.]|nr:hypothetical protein [Methyloceanibacter sp.]